MTGNGFVRIPRIIFTDVFPQLTVKQISVLMALYGMVNYKKGVMFVSGKRFEVNPGECITSINSLAKASGKNNTPSGVRTTLDKLKRMGIATHFTTQYATHVKFNAGFTFDGVDVQGTTQFTNGPQHTYDTPYDTLTTHRTTTIEEEERRKRKNKKEKERSITPLSLRNTSVSTRTKKPPCPYEKIKQAYNEICASLPEAFLDSKLRASIKARWNDKAHFNRDMGRVMDYFNRIEDSDFLTGRATDWRADMPWIMGPKNFAKVMNGRYDNSTRLTKPSGIPSDFFHKAMAEIWPDEEDKNDEEKV